ncbi:DNA replication complex GINS family protein [Candidatus Bathyarchaeota archaeon]|nr:MAG: DNA replication complex GINS family protein [Candidatus Bathyarchaeota archaeon]
MASIGDVFFDFENMLVRIAATRKIPAIETPGIKIDETEAGGVLTVPVWVAFELVEAGLARLVDEGVSGEEWTQIHYRERFQPLGQPSPLPGSFYSKVYLTFLQEIKRAKSGSVRAENLERMRGRFRDIIESRIGKVTRLASAEVEAQTRNLQPEEAALYKELFRIISEWRRSMKKLEEG